MSASEQYEKQARDLLPGAPSIAVVYSNLAIAASIREQTEVFRMSGIRVHQNQYG